MFKDRLKELRTKNQMTQDNLAKSIHVSRSAVCKWEMGNGMPSDVNIESICSLFNVSKEWLMETEDENIKNDELDRFDKKQTLLSFLGVSLSIVLTILSNVNFLPHQIKGNTAILLKYSNVSITQSLGIWSNFFIVVYLITFLISLFALLKIVKDEKRNKLVLICVTSICFSILCFFSSLTIALLK